MEIIAIKRTPLLDVHSSTQRMTYLAKPLKVKTTVNLVENVPDKIAILNTLVAETLTIKKSPQSKSLLLTEIVEMELTVPELTVISIIHTSQILRNKYANMESIADIKPRLVKRFTRLHRGRIVHSGQDASIRTTHAKNSIRLRILCQLYLNPHPSVSKESTVQISNAL